MGIRAQYHFRPTGDDILIWDVRKLVELAADLPIIQVPLDAIAELDETYWFSPTGYQPTVRSVADHAALINACDLSFPILLCAEGRVMDGMHRVARSHLEGRATVAARRFAVTPPHDHINIAPEDLSYD